MKLRIKNFPMDIRQEKTDRFIFLKKLWEETNATQNNMKNMFDIGKQLGFDSDQTKRIYDYLEGEKLIEAAALGGGIFITHWGIKEIEEALEHPDTPTQHFLPVNFTYINSMTNSVVQQGTSNSSVSVAFNSNQLPALEVIIESLKTNLNSWDLSTDLKSELDSELQTLEIQKGSPKPKSEIIKESLKSIRTILEGIVSGAGATGIISLINALL